MTSDQSPIKVATSFIKGSSQKVYRFLKEELSYKSSDEVYDDREEYMNFIGKEIDENANFGRQVAFIVSSNHPGISKEAGFTLVETCSGPGTVSRDIHLDSPNSSAICLEFAKEMCEFGKQQNPHLDFIQCDVTKLDGCEHLVNKVDLAFNSASSLGFFDSKQLLNHLKVMASMLKDGGAYYADQGYYSSILAAGLINERIDTVSEYKGETLYWRTLTTGYHPKTDFHDIAYSGWRINGSEAELVIAVKHTLRAYRASEMAMLAEMAGLDFRIHRLYWAWDESLGHYVFTFDPVDNDTLDHYPMQNYVFEFHKGNPVSISDSEHKFTGFSSK